MCNVLHAIAYKVTVCYWMTIIHVIYEQWWRQTLLAYVFAPEKQSNRCEIVALMVISLISTGNLCYKYFCTAKSPTNIAITMKNVFKKRKQSAVLAHLLSVSIFYTFSLSVTCVWWSVETPRSIFGHKINQVVPGSKPM